MGRERETDRQTDRQREREREDMQKTDFTQSGLVKKNKTTLLAIGRLDHLFVTSPSHQHETRRQHLTVFDAVNNTVPTEQMNCAMPTERR